MKTKQYLNLPIIKHKTKKEKSYLVLVCTLKVYMALRQGSQALKTNLL